MNQVAPQLATSLEQELVAIVGAEHLRWPGEVGAPLSRDTTPKVEAARALVFPGSTEEVQALVRLANREKVPLWPCSRGRNWGYGGNAPAQAGALVVSLERMNRVHVVDEALAYAEIEPGVSYRQLRQHLDESGSSLWTDCTDGPPEGSVIGNALDRGVGETPYGDHFGQLCGLEVVLPDGTLFHSGGGEPGNCRTWHTHRWGTGPHLDGLFSQGNFGIVTKAGIWLMPRPEAFQSYFFELAEGASLYELIDAIRSLALAGTIRTNIHLINAVVTASLLARHREIAAGATIEERELDAFRRRHGIAPWTFGGGLYGSKGEVAAQRRALKRALGRLGRLRFLDDRSAALVGGAVQRLAAMPENSLLRRLGAGVLRLGSGKSLQMLESVPHFHGIQKGIPTEHFVRHAYFKHPGERPDRDVNPARDGCGLMWVAPVAPATGQEVRALLELTRPIFARFGFEHYVAMILQNPRTMIVLMSIFFDKSQAEEVEQAQALYEALCAATGEAGYPQYRTGVAYMDRILARAPVFRDFADTLKAAADPNLILAPGRYGLGQSGPSSGA